MGDTTTFDIGIVEDAELQSCKCKGKSIYICSDGIDILAPQDAMKSKNCLVRVAILELDTVNGARRVTAVKALGDVLDNAAELGTCVYTDADGVTRHYVAGELHREGDLPAVDGPFIKEYYNRGNLHRAGNQPARQLPELKEYWRYGKRHRDEGPAIITCGAERIVEYWCNGQQHRDGDRPAVVSDSPYWKRRVWAQHGMIHRADGKPAIIAIDARTGERVGMQWVENGQNHRDGGLPATVGSKNSGLTWCWRGVTLCTQRYTYRQRIITWVSAGSVIAEHFTQLSTGISSLRRCEGAHISAQTRSALVKMLPLLDANKQPMPHQEFAQEIASQLTS